MLNPLRRSSVRPSAPLAISVVALISSLTGAAFAAGMLPAGSVGTAQVKAAAITAPKVATNAIGTTKVANRSLRAVDFAPGQLPAGAKGDAGAPGTALAYARVDVAGTPSLASGSTKAFTSVRRASLGSYCLTPTAGISPTERPAVVSAQGGTDSVLVTPGQYVVWQPDAAGCSAGDYQVRTYRIFAEVAGGPALADDVSFSIIVA